MFKKSLCASLALIMAMSLSFSAFAADPASGDTPAGDGSGDAIVTLPGGDIEELPTIVTATGDSTVPVKLTAEGATFKVTVPTALPISVAADGTVTTASDVFIVNESTAPVKLTKVEVKAAAGSSWTLQDFDKDYSNVPVNSKMMGFKIFDKNVPSATGLADLTGVSVMQGAAALNNANKLAVPYMASLATQSTALTDEHPLDVVFTLNWDTEAVA